MKWKIWIIAIAALLLSAGVVVTAKNQAIEMTEVTGMLTYNNGYFYINDIKLHFGPRWYITNTQSPYDFDGDGVLETIFVELQGLVGTTCTMKGHLQADNTLSVFYINDLLYREQGYTPWI